MDRFREKVDLIWDLANLLRGDYKPHEYADVILPLVVLRRLDQAMAPPATPCAKPTTIIRANW